MGTLLDTESVVKSGNLEENSAYKSNKTVIIKVVITIIMFAFGLVMIVPLLFMLSSSFKTTTEIFSDPWLLIPKNIFLKNYDTILHHKYFFEWYQNSILVVVGNVALRILIIPITAYSFARLRFRGKDTLFMLFMVTMMITPDTTIVARYLQYKYMHMLNSLWVLIIPAVIEVFFLFLLRQFFMTIPKDLTEAAIIDGCSHFKVFYQIIMPLAKPPIVTMVLFTFIWTWNDFSNPFVFISNIKTQVVSAGLKYFQSEAGPDQGLQLAGATLIIIPPILGFTFAQKYFVEGIAQSGIKG